MGISYIGSRVISNIEITKDIYKLHLEGSFDAKPGQFFMLSAWEGQQLLPRPISVYDIDEKGIYFLYQTKGKGTKIVSKLRNKDIINLLGPLGNGFDVNSIKGKVAIVAGGIGTAPMNYLAKRLVNCDIDLLYGFRDEVYGIESSMGLVNGVYITTESGAYGRRGYVTDIFKPEEYDVVLCCGPEIMMKKIVQKCREVSVPVYVSMENFMACGLGACLVCTCKTVNGNKRTCADGPVFLGEELILNA